ncbi:hypothetical protein SLH46_16710 [Draconibacterium sp. IB214405]|uniref:hypothetical protein n=1 Tax=Draconibacterium sp. IB214405 TaxID=3097352 RepID=UPI002A13D2F3|nr:hypothetical protein [Draconibacterium sp. IB214405]MDX8340841.1 hypothetical protein [Draconibacterium sp. IB214405]
MDNKKLFKFLYKDISEIEELFAEKGAEGFDELEMEFIRTRFSGAKNIIQLLSEKEIKSPEVQIPQPAVADNNGSSSEKTEAEIPAAPRTELTEDEKAGLKELEEFEAEIADKEDEEPETIEEPVEKIEPVAKEVVEETAEVVEAPKVVAAVEETIEEEISQEEVEKEKPVVDEVREEEETEEVEETNTRIGDRPVAGKSVNDLLGGKEDGKLEYKISNSPVTSIQAAIGINDRYQYIRELFDGNADTFAKTVSDLDGLTNINEAVEYLQQNFKWKKNETSLKFVGLVKRRFPNG